MGAVTYTWDDNGNLLSDGVSTYTYDRANRLKTAVQGGTTYGYSYSGLGDRLRQTVNAVPTNYTLDLETGVTQVLDDGPNTYLYGVTRIGEKQTGGWQYHLGDALGSVRQLTSPAGAVTLARSYEPFGDTLTTSGSAQTVWQYTGEARDATGLTFLRARYYASAVGRFVSRDVWEGDPNQPMSYNAWVYAEGNPATVTDPTGNKPCNEHPPDKSEYCKLEGGGFDTAIIDVDHFRDSRDLARQIREGLGERVGDDPGVLTVRTTQAKFFQYIRTYATWLPMAIPEPTLDHVSLGIFLHFQRHLELSQVTFSPISAFSNEDLPSDYLGFAAAIIRPGYSLNDMGRWLGAEMEDAEDLGIYRGTFVQAIECHYLGECGDDSPFNCDFAFKLLDPSSGKYKHVAWPSDLQWTPIPAGAYWAPIEWPPSYGE